ncbi:hypothetical protein SVAN01_09661 [Stagonosporopsis vannaccii]|nr:hypothetical protein SVAN01_09661 [Stagonosporopsis vannaccii]
MPFQAPDSDANNDNETAAHGPPTPQVATPFILTTSTSTTTPTPVPNAIHPLATSTITPHPAIIASPVPSAHPPTAHIILPFQIQLWEYCGPAGARLAAGKYLNGNLGCALDLSPRMVMVVKHFIPCFDALQIGPYDYSKGVVRFGYRGCGWRDDETWRSCGECRATA